MWEQAPLINDWERVVILSFNETKVERNISYNAVDDCFRGPQEIV